MENLDLMDQSTRRRSDVSAALARVRQQMVGKDMELAMSRRQWSRIVELLQDADGGSEGLGFDSIVPLERPVQFVEAEHDHGDGHPEGRKQIRRKWLDPHSQRARLDAN